MIAVYRHFDAAGALLYVGVAKDLNARTKQHKANSPWFTRVTDTRVEFANSRNHALALEAVAIRYERPLYNKPPGVRGRTGPIECDPNLTSVHSVTEKVPHSAICKRFGVKERSIRLARERGVFPASWYKGMEELCAKYGAEFSDHLFNMKSPIDATATKRGDVKANIQAPTSERGAA